MKTRLALVILTSLSTASLGHALPLSLAAGKEMKINPKIKDAVGTVTDLTCQKTTLRTTEISLKFILSTFNPRDMKYEDAKVDSSMKFVTRMKVLKKGADLARNVELELISVDSLSSSKSPGQRKAVTTSSHLTRFLKGKKLMIVIGEKGNLILANGLQEIKNALSAGMADETALKNALDLFADPMLLQLASVSTEPQDPMALVQGHRPGDQWTVVNRKDGFDVKSHYRFLGWSANGPHKLAVFSVNTPLLKSVKLTQKPGPDNKAPESPFSELSGQGKFTLDPQTGERSLEVATYSSVPATAGVPGSRVLTLLRREDHLE